MSRKIFSIAFSFLLFISNHINAQQSDYVRGEFLVQIKAGHSANELVNDLSRQAEFSSVFIKKEIAPVMRVWLIGYDASAIDEYKIFIAIANHPAVNIIQRNHVFELRSTVPNDPMYNQQWQYDNTGQSGGTAGADIDVDLAWDITTGGVTALGDTIVACIVDDGLDLTHDDFEDNLWVNHYEIANNNIDDDLNGYVDDYAGWDAASADDDISGGGHGTAVTGIVGAKGNNNLGVSGVNWNVKLMIVKYGSADEAHAIAAYSYPLTMRKIYNETNGAEGAFVVVTNSSWGVDFGQPADAPLWCAMYDSMGKYGIISCAATINGNQNVDVVGDLPTACASDYLITVTNMDDDDVKVTSAGYGATTIDLGAFGANVYTTDFGNGYGGFGGTSGATPHVAGTVALLYSAPCPQLIADAKLFPDSVALLMKQFIFDGVDANASLQGITVTGGRLNTYNALLEALSYNCNSGSCFTPFNIDAENVIDTTAEIIWDALSGASAFNLRWRMQGDTVWNYDTTALMNYSLMNLQACSFYEIEIENDCDTATSGYSPTFVFKTDGCCEPPTTLGVDTVTENSATVFWSPVLAANVYNVRHKELSSSNWILDSSIPATELLLDTFPPCTDYEFQVQTVCDTGTTNWSASQFFKTKGCINCSDVTYCDAYGQNSSYEWIESVYYQNDINPWIYWDNNSGNNNGYAFFDSLGILSGPPAIVLSNCPNTLTIFPGFSGTAFNEYFRAWIDFNADGDFDDADELVFEEGPSTGPISGTMNINGWWATERTVMRIEMMFDQFPDACGSFDYGEVEDYCIIGSSCNGIENNSSLSYLNIYPNPFTSQLALSFRSSKNTEVEVSVMNLLGQQILSEKFEAVNGENHFSINIPVDLASGAYLLMVRDGDGEAVVRKIIRN